MLASIAGKTGVLRAIHACNSNTGTLCTNSYALPPNSTSTSEGDRPDFPAFFTVVFSQFPGKRLVISVWLANELTNDEERKERAARAGTLRPTLHPTPPPQRWRTPECRGASPTLIL